MKKALLFALVLVGAGAMTLAAVPADASPKPVVTEAFADPYTVGAGGGFTVVISHMENATTCSLSVVGPKGIVDRLPQAKNCSKGLYTAEIGIAANPTKNKRAVELEVHASGATGLFFVTQYAGTGNPTSTPTTTTVAPPPVTTTSTLPVPCTEGCANPPFQPPAPTTTAPATSSTTVAPTTTTVAPTTSTTEAATTTTGVTTTTVPPTTTTVPSTTTTTEPPTTTTSVPRVVKCKVDGVWALCKASTPPPVMVCHRDHRGVWVCVQA